jgi:hypothetical protein
MNQKTTLKDSSSIPSKPIHLDDGPLSCKATMDSTGYNFVIESMLKITMDRIKEIVKTSSII